MVQEQITRKLTAILAADVAGYSRLMSTNEEGTLQRLGDSRRSLFDPKVSEYRGRIFKTTGDGLLIEFSSVVDAVRCAVDVQRAMAERNAGLPDDERMDFRMGINLGDVMAVGDDIYGDGVNVASRIEGLADPGRICVSKLVFDQVRDKLDLAFEDLGDKQLKNIARPIRILRVRLDGTKARSRPAVDLRRHLVRRRSLVILVAALVLALAGGYVLWRFAGHGSPAAPLGTAGPSVAVLPFADLTDKAQQISLAEGVTEDIVSQLAQVAGLFVVSRNVMTQANPDADVRGLGEELGVRYVVKGSVRAIGTQLRITAQLVEVATGEDIWGKRFDLMGDEAKAQDEATEDITSELIIQMRHRDLQLAKRTPIGELDPYGFYLLGKDALSHDDFQGIQVAREMFNAAVAKNPSYAPGWAGLALVALREFRLGRSALATKAALDAMFVLAQKALKLAPDSSDAQQVVANVYLFRRLYDQAIDLLTSRITASADDAGLSQALGDVYIFAGETREGLAQLDYLMRLDPFHDQAVYAIYGRGYILADSGSKAIQNVELCMARAPEYRPCFDTAAVAYVEAGELAQAETALARSRVLDPRLSVAVLPQILPFKKPDELARFEKGLSAAGLK